MSARILHINEKMEIGELPPHSEDIFDFRYATDVIVHVSRKAIKHLLRELLTFLQASSLNANDYQTELSSFHKCKIIHSKFVRNSLDCPNWKTWLVVYKSQHGPDVKQGFFVENFEKVLKENYPGSNHNTCSRGRKFLDQEATLLLRNYCRRL